MIDQVIRVMKVDKNGKKGNVVSVRVFCCFSLGLLYACPPPPPPPDGKVGIRVTENFGFPDLRLTSFNPRTILFSLFFTSWQCSSFVMGNVPIGSPYTFTIYSIHFMANLSTKDCQTMWTIIFFTSWQCSSFVMGNDDRSSDLSDESQPKCEKSPPKSLKNEIFIFILRSTSDDWPSNPSDESQSKCKRMNCCFS